MKKLFLLLIPYSLFLTPVVAQQVKHTQLIQLSGVVVQKDSLLTIPFVAIIRKHPNSGTISDYNGYYSLIVVPGDTIQYSAIGFKSRFYVIPDTLTGDKYAHIHLMQKDTFSIPTATISSRMPSYEIFRQKFLNLDLPGTDMERAKKNMLLAAEKARLEGNPMDARANFINTQQQEFDKLYYAGQLPPNNLLNPISWANFIQAWKNGALNIQ